MSEAPLLTSSLSTPCPVHLIFNGSHTSTDSLQATYPRIEVVVSSHSTHGDQVLDQHLASLASSNPGLFTKELEVCVCSHHSYHELPAAWWTMRSRTPPPAQSDSTPARLSPPQTGLLAGAFDCVVHSLKDVPTTLPDSLALVAISDREDPRDCVLLPAGTSPADHADGLAALHALAPGSCVGTSSLRREALLAARCDGLVTHAVRGNLNTRYAKLCGEHDSCAQPGAPQYKALLLAAAGVQRLGWQERVAGYLPGDEWPWGVGQGCLGVEVKCTPRGAAVGAMIKRAVGDSAGTAACVAERAFLKELQGGCQVPLGTYTTQADAGERAVHVVVKGVVLSGDGATELSATVEADIPKMTSSEALPPVDAGLSFTHMWCSQADAELVAQAEALGKALAQPLLAKGAAALIHGESRGITYGKA